MRKICEVCQAKKASRVFRGLDAVPIGEGRDKMTKIRTDVAYLIPLCFGCFKTLQEELEELRTLDF